MSIICPTCSYENLDDAEFCDACGSELGAAKVNSSASGSVPTAIPNITPPPPPPVTPNSIPTVVSTPPNYQNFTGAAATARLISKQPGSPTSEFPLDGGNAIIGIFDPNTGPVDIDLETFPGNETVSRQHAEIYHEGGVWKIKDLRSTNGVFIKPFGQSHFGAKITMPEALNSGDEIAIAKIRFLFQSP